jgi:hypothetical protein
MKTTFDAIILKYSTKWMQHLHPIRNLITCRWLVVYYVLFFSIALKKVCLFIGLFQENLALADVYEHASNQVTTHKHCANSNRTKEALRIRSCSKFKPLPNIFSFFLPHAVVLSKVQPGSAIGVQQVMFVICHIKWSA